VSAAGVAGPLVVCSSLSSDSTDGAHATGADGAEATSEYAGSDVVQSKSDAYLAFWSPLRAW
jgi:hypothetical protein